MDYGISKGDMSAPKIIELINLASLSLRAISLAHDIRGPLLAIEACCSQKLDKQTQQEIFHSGITKIRKMCGDFLNYTKDQIKSDPAQHSCSVEQACEAIQEIIKIHSQLGVKGISFRYSKSLEPKRQQFLSLNSTDLCRIIANLIDNSVDARASRIDVTLSCDSKTLTLTFADNGEKVSNSALRNIGELGYTTKNSGFGYAVFDAKQVISRNGGYIRHKARRPHGLTTKICLPIQHQANCFLKPVKQKSAQ